MGSSSGSPSQIYPGMGVLEAALSDPIGAKVGRLVSWTYWCCRVFVLRLLIMLGWMCGGSWIYGVRRFGMSAGWGGTPTNKLAFGELYVCPLVVRGCCAGSRSAATASHAHGLGCAESTHAQLKRHHHPHFCKGSDS